MAGQASATLEGEKVGLEHWMEAVLEECDSASRKMTPDTVHDLRVALRRCLSIAGDLVEIDPDPTWRKMRKAGRRLFKRLGNLRDTQVMTAWVKRLAATGDPVGKLLLKFLAAQEQRCKEDARLALRSFDRKRWKYWARVLPRRAAQLPLDGPAFEHMALERWNEAYILHGRALRSRSKVAFHRLRIAIKRFRYTVENFLPRRHAQWGGDLKARQDILGEMHDLDVLWQTALRFQEFSSAEIRADWRARIEKERNQRLEQYRHGMGGKESLWRLWRAGLPQGEQLELACVAKLAAWASFRTPDFAHAQHVARLALGLYDKLAANGLAGTDRNGRTRRILHGAALMHDVGRTHGGKAHHKTSYRMISKLTPPIGWTPEDMHLAALVARYHRRALPRPQHKGFHALPSHLQQRTLLLAGILRLANAFDRQHDAAIRRTEVERSPTGVVIRAEGYTEEEPLASDIANARHLLEIACRQAILVLPGAKPPVRVSHADCASDAA